MKRDIVIPAQIRAGRALLGWTQEQLAKEAEVALSTVRDTESEKRAADTDAVRAMRRALWNGGVVFVPGAQDRGPGVCLVASWPNIIRRPTTTQRFEGMPFAVEWQGKVVTVFIAIEVLDDLDGHRDYETDEVYLKTFDRHRGQLLDAVAMAISDPENFDQYGRLYIRQKDLDALKAGQWHRVVIGGDEAVQTASARTLIDEFVATYMHHGLPPNVEVYRDRRETSEFVCYFSPRAAAIAHDLLMTFQSKPCEVRPDIAVMKKIQL